MPVTLSSRPREKAQRTAFLIREITRLLPPAKQIHATHILDIGCGRGEFIHGLEQQGYRVVGIDARTDFTFRRNVVRGDALHLPFRSGAFDGSLMVSILEHISTRRWPTVLAENQRVLRHGARTIVQIPNPYFLIELHSRIPLYAYLPTRLRESLFRAFYHREPDFEIITERDVRSAFENEGLEFESSASYVFPPEALPKSVRSLASIIGRIPMGFLMVFVNI